ncbi:TPA: transposase zinc-binding domain-containing protein [Clostridioides difficile]|nr:transposase zinc-binding domain-containing protein [Clostridioides difficile]
MNIEIKYKNDKIINTILENYFKEFKDTMWNKVRKDMREQIESTVEKALNCGNIERGYIKHKCLDCGEEYIQGFTCKSKFCTKCGRKYSHIIYTLDYMF